LTSKVKMQVNNFQVEFRLFVSTTKCVCCQIKSPSLQSIKLSTLNNLGCLRIKKGLQGGKTIQQRSEFFASQWPLMLLRVLYIHACALSAHTRVSISLWLAATPLSLPGAGTVYSDILGLIVLHGNMTRHLTGLRNLTLYRVF